MATLVEKIASNYKYVFSDSQNPITKKWFLIGNPFIFVSIIAVYLLYCTKIGPWQMRNRRPYDLKNVIKIYNFFQVLISVYIFYQAANRVFFNDFNLNCQASDIDSPFFYWEAKISYYYFIAKITELLDTVFFVLRKSYRQISFLHLFHHTLMPTGCWIGMMYYPGGNAAIMGLFNSFVHIVMYTYYLIASYGDQYKHILWWKKYVTIIQLVQFVAVGLHSVNSLFYSCGYPTVFKILTVFNSIFFFNLFWNFYSKNYLRKKTEKPRIKQINSIHKNGKSKSS